MYADIKWLPSCSIHNLKARASIVAKVRRFFKAREVWEVETPLLGEATATDPHIHSLNVSFAGKVHYLQTSPEFPMKRLLAAGSGSIYQISKAFRAEEVGNLHHREFTLLEWYRVGFDHHDLMDEVDAFLQNILSAPCAKRMTYTEVFLEHLNIHPLTASTAALRACALKHGFCDHAAHHGQEKDFWLQALMSCVIEPQLSQTYPTFIFDFPASQAALARVCKPPDSPAVAERFEVYHHGVELANGYHELCDPKEQMARFCKDNRYRKSCGLAQIPIDHALINALKSGLPPCAGVAVGLDRLVMLALAESRIDQVCFQSA